MDRLLVLQPNDARRKVWRAFIELNWKADTRPLHQMIDSVRATNPAAMPGITEEWIICALAERDAATAAIALGAFGENNLGNEVIKYSPRFVEGLIARMTKDDAKARAAFTAARAEQEKVVQAHPDNAGAVCDLDLIDAALGKKRKRCARAGVSGLLPVEKDAPQGTRIVVCLAMIAAWVGDNNLACEQLATAIRYPTSPSYGQLKLLPFWDPLRGDPCFEKIVASLAPK